eukprot:TRINITY_DN22746_c2_g1_i2.p1 TRINITY_DN22746_c2_g1~~TRINITY_DN22746_c2_g1_i2.p1  ORF type:complete len:223 (+),score=4.19 TRINITY_DN22746_c2_g1_i2:183-851(+)
MVYNAQGQVELKIQTQKLNRKSQYRYFSYDGVCNRAPFLQLRFNSRRFSNHYNGFQQRYQFCRQFYPVKKREEVESQMSYNCRQIKRPTLDQKVSQQYFCQPTKTSQRKFKNVRIRFLLQCTQGFSNNLGLQNQHNSRIKQTKIFCQSQSSSNISQSQQDVRQQNSAQNQDQQQDDDEDNSDYELEGDNVDENFISNVQFTQDKYSLDQGGAKPLKCRRQNT